MNTVTLDALQFTSVSRRLKNMLSIPDKAYKAALTLQNSKTSCHGPVRAFALCQTRCCHIRRPHTQDGRLAAGKQETGHLAGNRSSGRQQVTYPEWPNVSICQPCRTTNENVFANHLLATYM
jgi:hypothetical protein